LTLPQVRAGLASLLRAACGCDTPERIVRDRKRWLTRNARDSSLITTTIFA
jgi:hypothetical protein